MRLPNDTERHMIIGRTGSGKTQLGVWELSLRSYNAMPWIAFNSKGDRLIDAIGAPEISVHKKPPSKEGLYVCKPLPNEDKALEQFLWRCWAQEGVGIYVDEGYLMGRNNAAFRALLTQGRSKLCPMIILSQRPVYMDRFVWSESEFFSVFHLQNRNDQDVVETEVFGDKPVDWSGLTGNVYKYHSLYYDVGADTLTKLKPVPSRDAILATFRERMPQQGTRWV